MNITHIENQDGSIDITISLSSSDVMQLKHDLPGVQGIVDWFAKGPSFEKVSRSGERMDNAYRDVLDNDPAVTSIPADRTARLELIAARADYKDREARDQE